MAQRANSLGPKPSLSVVFFFFAFFVSNTKKTCFPPRKGHFLLFLSVSLCFSLAYFGLPLFQFFFLCLSLFFSFFLPVLLFCFLCFLVFVSLIPFLSSLLLFHEKNNIKIFNYKVFLHQYVLFFWFLVLFSL